MSHDSETSKTSHCHGQLFPSRRTTIIPIPGAPHFTLTVMKCFERTITAQMQLCRRRRGPTSVVGPRMVSSHLWSTQPPTHLQSRDSCTEMLGLSSSICKPGPGRSNRWTKINNGVSLSAGSPPGPRAEPPPPAAHPADRWLRDESPQLIYCEVYWTTQWQQQ